MSDIRDMDGGDPEEAELDGMDEEESGETPDADGEEDDGDGPPARPASLEESIARLDGLLEAAEDEGKIRAGLGIRLALGMAQELKSGQPLGSETGDMVAEWVERYGQDTVDAAVAIARQFLTKPEDMRKALGQRLGLGNAD